MTHSRVSPWAIGGLYVFAIALVTSPPIDLLTAVWPLRPRDVQWRSGFLGLGAAYLLTPLLGLVLAMAVAYSREHARTLKGLGLMSALAGAALIPVLVVFPLDVLQMRALSVPEAQSQILIGGVIQETKHFGAFVVLVCLGFGAVRTAGQLVAQDRTRPGRSNEIVSKAAGRAP